VIVLLDCDCDSLLLFLTNDSNITYIFVFAILKYLVSFIIYNTFVSLGAVTRFDFLFDFSFR
jgi:hypothetical protein